MAWLELEPIVPGSLAEVDEDTVPAREANAEQLELLLAGRDIPLPQSFLRFVSSPGPRCRIRSCTACYLDLADSITATDDGWLIHFLSDQQWCLHWYLFIGKSGEESVVVTDEPLGFDYEDDEGQRGYEVACRCAHTFTEFIYRFWIENEIAYAGYDDEELSDRERQYAECYLQ